MPSVIGNILIGMGVDTSGLDRGFGRATGKVQSFAVEVRGVGASLRNTLVAGLAGGGVAGVLIEAARAASDLNEQLSAAGVVFGASADVVTVAANQMAQDFGTVKSEFLEAANSLGSLFTAVGKTREQSADLSVQFVKLAMDLSSIRNVPTREALDAIRSGLVGEAEPLRRFGVLLSEAAVANEALRLGLVKNKNELTDQQKLVARMSLITAGLGYANGDLARTIDGVANQARSAAGRWTNAMAALGKSFEPVSQAVLAMGSNAIGFLTSKIQENQENWIQWAKSTGAALKSVAEDGHTIGDFFAGLLRVGLLIRGVIRGVAGAIAYLAAGVVGLVADLVGIYDTIQRQFTGKDSTIAAWIQGLHDELKAGAIGEGAMVLDDFGRAFGKLSDDASKSLAKVGDAAKAAGKTTADALKPANDQLEKMKDWADVAKKHEEGLASAARSLIEQTTTPAEKLRDETMKIRELLAKGYIDKTTAARGLLAAQSDVGIGKVQYAGAVEAGSVEARSAILAANSQVATRDDGLAELAKINRDTAASNAKAEATLARLENMLRQFLGTAAGPQTVRFGS